MRDRLKILSLKTLCELDDSLPADFETMLAAAVKDCLKRPTIKKKRQVTIIVEITPILRQDGTVDDLRIDIQVAGKSPARIIPTVVARATVSGGLKWSPTSPSNPDQSTLFDGEES
jgi:hypothetical protein